MAHKGGSHPGSGVSGTAGFRGRLTYQGEVAVTIRISKRVLIVLLVVMAVAGAGVGGYVVGRHSRAGLASKLSGLQRRDASVAADEFVHQRDTAQLLINLCREVGRLPPAFGSFDPASCNPGALVYLPSGPQALIDHNGNVLQGIKEICFKVLQVEGATAYFDERRAGCLQHYQLLPSQLVPIQPFGRK